MGKEGIMKQFRHLRYDPETQVEERKISRVLTVILLVLAIVFLSSCGKALPVPQEMGNMALLRCMAVDQGDEVPWLVTVATGKQAKDGGEVSPLLFQNEADTLPGACHNIAGDSEAYVFFGYVDQLLLGKELVKEGILPVLDYVSTQQALSLGTGIWMTQGDSQDILLQNQEEGCEGYLRTIMEESDLGISGISRKVGEVMGEILTWEGTYIPILSQGEGESLGISGYGIFRQDRLVTIFQQETVAGFQLLAEHPQQQEWHTELGDFALAMEGIRREVRGVWQEDTLVEVQIHLAIQGELLSYPKGLEEAQWQQAWEEMELDLRLQCLRTLEQCQNYQVDPLQLQGALALRYPYRKELLQAKWQEDFPNCEIQLTCSLDTIRLGGA